MINVTIEIKGFDKAINLLGRIKSEVKNNQFSLQKVGEYLKRFYTDHVFSSEGSVYGRRWSSLAPSTVREKTKQYPGRGILERTGTMRRGFRVTTMANHLRLFNTVPYAQFHQTGTTKMPQRTIMAVDQERIGQVSKILIEEIMNKIHKSL